MYICELLGWRRDPPPQLVPASGRPEGGQALPLTFAMTDLRLVNGAGQKTSLLTAGGCGYCSGLDKI
jgi:hypothetical protein